MLFFAESGFFWDFKCIYLVNGISDSIKPIHFLKVLNEDFTIKQTVFKYIQVEKNDVISKMADFAIFWPKNANISWTIYPIMINHTIFFILNSGSIRGPPFESPDTPHGGLFWVVVPQTSHKTLNFVNNDPFATQSTHVRLCPLTVESLDVRARTINLTVWVSYCFVLTQGIVSISYCEERVLILWLFKKVVAGATA